MSRLIGIVGASGSGKSTSLRNLDPKATFIISPSKGELPIPGFKKKYSPSKNQAKEGNFHMTNKLSDIPIILKAINDNRPEIKQIILEDTTHFFNSTTLSNNFRGQNTGNAAWSRWGDFGASVYNALFNKTVYRDDLTIITMFHPESYMTPEGERLKIKTPGNLLEREVDIPSYYTTLLYTKVIPVDKNDPKPATERYKFVTNDDGYAPAKSPFGAFDELYVENDLNTVLQRLDELAINE